MALALWQKFVWILLVLGNFVTISLQASTQSSDSYVAAVVEYAPVSGATLENKEQIFMENVAVYGCLMEEAAKQEVDIIVFPEIGLASYGVPRNPDGTPSLAFYVPEPGSNPCDDNSTEIAQGLKQLSCSARKHGLYAVVNLPERVNCSACPCPGFPVTIDGEECPPSGAYFHNTNVVFDRNGNIVARYRKFNLFGEPGFVPTQQPEFAFFETDFGVTFGTFICFDILFEKPAADLVLEHGICDFAFPTAWFSEVPFLTAVQEQTAWSYSLDVNLLAAGYNKPEAGSAGSGIFLGRSGAAQQVMPNTTTSRLLVAAVPKKQRCKERAAERQRERERERERARSRRALPPGGDVTGDDDEDAEERTPLSAFHHIVRQRKLGHVHGDDDEGEELVEESAPAFIHHTMFDRDRDNEDDEDSEEDPSQPPSGEYEPKTPPHFMGLQQADRDGDEEGCSDDQVEGHANGATSHSSSPFGDHQKEGIPEKKIPTSTDTDPHGFTGPSQNPDLLKLYQEEPVEKFPEEFLEIEVPEERIFEPDHDHEYFKLPEGGQIPPSHDEMEQRPSKERERASAAAADTGDLSVPQLEVEQETEEKDAGAPKWEASGDVHERSYDEERNATEQEIEDIRKKFEWLTDDKDEAKPSDSPEHVKKLSVRDRIDDTDDVLPDDLGLDLLEAGGHDEQLPDIGGQEEAAPRRDNVDETDDVLPDHLGLREPDIGDSSATSRKQEAESAEGSEADSPAENIQPIKGPCKVKKPTKRRQLWRSLRDRPKRECSKCKQKREEQKFRGEGEGADTDDKPAAVTSEYGSETVAENAQSEEQPAGGEGSDLDAVAEEAQCEEQPVKRDTENASSKPKCKCRPRERPESACPPFSDGVLDDPRVPKSTVGLFLKTDHLERYKTFTLNTETLIENSTVLLCHGTFCCNFHVVLEVNADLEQPRYAYRLAVFDGVRSFDGVATGGVQVCAVIPCSRDDLESCGMLTLPDEAAYATVFRNISISGIFSTNHTLVTANSLAPGLLPLPVDKFNMSSTPLADSAARVTVWTTPAVQEEGISIYTFAIYSRVFNRDGQPVSAPP